MAYHAPKRRLAYCKEAGLHIHAHREEAPDVDSDALVVTEDGQGRDAMAEVVVGLQQYLGLAHTCRDGLGIWTFPIADVDSAHMLFLCAL